MVLIIMVQMHDDDDDCFFYVNDGDNSICEDNVN